jgi:hypothetical protein
VNWVRNLFCGALLAAAGLSLADADRHEPAATVEAAVPAEPASATDTYGAHPEPGGDDQRWMCWDDHGYTSCCRASTCCVLIEEQWLCG